MKLCLFVFFCHSSIYAYIHGENHLIHTQVCPNDNSNDNEKRKKEKKKQWVNIADNICLGESEIMISNEIQLIM